MGASAGQLGASAGQWPHFPKNAEYRRIMAFAEVCRSLLEYSGDLQVLSFVLVSVGEWIIIPQNAGGFRKELHVVTKL